MFNFWNKLRTDSRERDERNLHRGSDPITPDRRHAVNREELVKRDIEDLFGDSEPGRRYRVRVRRNMANSNS